MYFIGYPSSGGLIAEGNFEIADELFDELLVLGLVPNVYTYNVYIDGLCKRNNVEEGIKMVASMEKLGCKPNVISYNKLLEAFCKVAEMNKVRELVREMKSKGIELNLQTYRVVINGLVSTGEIFEACHLAGEVLDKCFFHHKLTLLDEVICGLCEKGLVCEAQALLKKMVDRSVSPGSRVWEILLLSSGCKTAFLVPTLIDLVGPV